MADIPNNPGVRRAVVTGIVSGTCVLLFVKPMLALLWKVALSNVQYMSDAACRTAALGYTDRYGFMRLSIAGSIVLGSLTGLLVLPRRDDPSGIRHRLSSELSRLIRSTWFVLPLAIVTFSSCVYLLTLEFLVLQMNASFNQRLMVVSPKISDQSYKEFLAAWAAMRSESDYRRIVEQMDAIAKTNGIVLPELLPGATPSN